MKKTIWQPLALGAAFELLASITMTSGLSFMRSSPEASHAIGFRLVLFLFSAAQSRPLAGAITSTKYGVFAALIVAADRKAGF